MELTEVIRLFSERNAFGPDLVVTSPARINLIGEHTDYNGGLVFPAAINRHLFFAIKKSDKTEIYSANQDQNFSFNPADVPSMKSLSWQRYFVGVADILLHKMNLNVGNFNLVFGGNIPLGAGISSSAALTCGFIFALNELFHLGLDKWQMARIGQQCEHEYIGVKCGIMDQFAVLFGEENAALLLDCSTLEYETIQFDSGKYTFLICNSMVSHNLASSAYNQRLNECGLALELINSKGNNFQNLSQINERDLDLVTDETAAKRATHVFYENQRTLQLKEALLNGEMEKAGELINQSHESLRDNYAVTCLETDFLHESINYQEGVLGCRQMGGGFGGCMIVLCESNLLEQIKSKTTIAYRNAFNLDAQFYDIKISKGCHLS
jgi:galactokinase